MGVDVVYAASIQGVSVWVSMLWCGRVRRPAHYTELKTLGFCYLARDFKSDLFNIQLNCYLKIYPKMYLI